LPRRSKEIKSAKEISLSAAKKVANQLAITNRRIRVADLLIQRYTMREIAVQLDVALSTVVLDKRSIDAELAEVYTEEYQWRRERELERLDMLERDIMNKITFAIDTEDELKWTNVQLRIMGMRAKWLGYDGSPKPLVMDTGDKTSNTLNQDNRQVINVTISTVDEKGKTVSRPFLDSLRDRFKVKVLGEPKELNEGVTT